jgi:UDP-N-acetylmuramate--alanine ligase
VLFQPHRYSRTRYLWQEFTRAFNQADLLVITDIYAASEAAIPGVSGEALAAAIREAGHKNVHYIRSMQDSIGFLLKQARPGDAILTIGAGSVSRASSELMILLGTDFLAASRPDGHAH